MGYSLSEAWLTSKSREGMRIEESVICEKVFNHAHGVETCLVRRVRV